jgi:hypothetical protein
MIEVSPPVRHADEMTCEETHVQASGDTFARRDGDEVRPTPVDQVRRAD